MRKGIDEDDLVALQLGKTRAEELTNVQQKYKEKLKQRLAEVQQKKKVRIVIPLMCSQVCDTALWTQEAELQRKEQAAKNKQFSLGKLAYGRGLYPESARLFEVALDKEGPFSKLGGEIQLWQALAYQVCSNSQIAGSDRMEL